MSSRLDPILARLARGEDVENYKEPGNSMVPIIGHREPVTLSPVDVTKLEAGDVVLVKVHGRFYTHLVGAVRNGKVKIQNNHGHVNGWAPFKHVYAIVSAVSGVPRRSALKKIKRK